MNAICPLMKEEYYNNMGEKSFAKKRMMFIQKEDYNFLTYNLLLLLDTLKCTTKQKSFKDFKKIAYLIPFINGGAVLDNYSQSELASIYSKAQLKKQLISHLLIILKNRDFIGVEINTTHNSFDIWIKKDNIPPDFFNKEKFQTEINNIKILKNYAYSLKTVPVKKLVDTIFTSNNIITWEI